MAKLNKSQKALFEAIKAATNGAEGFKFISQLDAEYLVEAGLIEVNNEMTDADGNVAARAVAETTPETNKAAPVSKFEIESGIEIPKKSSRGAGRASVYPFDSLEVGQSFFVGNSAEVEDAYKSMGSTVSSANARYAEEIPGETKTNRKGNVVPATKQTRQFMHVRAEKDGVQGTRVFRVAVDGEADQA
ncbi:hypothetical protein AH03_25 [Erwinia phage AH03]|uniref:Uncharacterized protein n=1 Tax=Erwinia phage AH03 TaxID=2869568 RepID=A0AAE8BPY3_9CAUD|nr:hypothetical protein AH03_25 [Erwinia phage AH03]